MACDHMNDHTLPAPRRRVHPLTWVAAAALLPLVCWDAWQTHQEVRVRRQASPHYGKLQSHELAPEVQARLRAW